MITFNGTPKSNSDNDYDFMGLSTDEKPSATDFPNMRNGSTFMEMDTKQMFFWDAENQDWV